MAAANTTTSKARTRSYELGELDLSRLGDRLKLDLRAYGSLDPVRVRLEVLRLQGWAAALLKVRRSVDGIDFDFDSPKSIIAPTSPVAIITLDQEDLDGAPVITIGSDTAEAASSLSIRAHITWAL